MAVQSNIEPGSQVTLTGTGTGAWAQTAGPAVVLTGTGATRTFTAPASLAGVQLVFTYAAITETVNVLPVTERVVVAGTAQPAVLFLGAVTGNLTSTPNPSLTISATAGDGVVDLSWTLGNGTATSFTVSRDGTDTLGSGAYTTTDPSTASSRRFDKLVNGTAYTFTVVANLSTGATVAATATATPAPTTVTATLNVTATPSDAAVAVAWALSNATAVSYTVGRNGTDSVGSGPYSTTDPATATARTFDKLINGTAYVFTVTANLSSGLQITQSVTATPAAPIVPTLKLTATPGDTYVDVGWALTNATATNFTVGRDGTDSVGSGPYSTTDPAGVTSRRFDKLVNGTPYLITVVANLTDGSTLTKTATATPAGSGGGTIPGPDPSGRTIPLAGFSGLAFNSICFLPDTSPAGATAFGNLRGRPMDGLLYFVGRGSWGEMKGSLGSDRAAWLASGRLMVTTLPHAPQVGDKSMNSKGANNDYYTDQRDFGAYLAANGFNSPRHVLRVDWECNGDWYDWSAKNGGAATLKQAIINYVTNVRAGGATQVKFDLCWNKGPSQAGADFSIYPGREYMDVIGVDQYDQWSPSFNDGQWNQEIARTPALSTIRDFAASNSIMWSLDEGGNTNPNDGNHGGDNPFYWQKIWQFFNANASRCAWHTTYNEKGAPDTLHHDFAANPNSWAYYRTTFGGF